MRSRKEIWIFEHNEPFNVGKAIAGYPNAKGQDLLAMKHYLRLMQTTPETGAMFCVLEMPAYTVKCGDVVNNLLPEEPENNVVDITQNQGKNIVSITDLQYNRLAKNYITADTWFYPHDL